MQEWNKDLSKFAVTFVPTEQLYQSSCNIVEDFYQH